MWDTLHWTVTLSDCTSLNVTSSGLTGSTGSKLSVIKFFSKLFKTHKPEILRKMEAEEETGLAGPRRGVRVTRHSYVAMSEKWTGLNVRLLCTPPTSPVVPDMVSLESGLTGTPS